MTTATARTYSQFTSAEIATPSLTALSGTDLVRALDGHRPGIQSFIRRKGFSPEEAEDLAQETILRAFQHRANFRGAFLRAWLYRIAANVTVDYVRRQRLVTVPLEDVATTAVAADDPVASWEQVELEQGLIALLQKLSPAQRQVLHLRYLEGCSLAEIAEQIHCTPLAARLRVFRALDALRRVARAQAHRSESLLV